MVHIPTTESYVQKVCRIAKELDISIEEASITCDAFHFAFSDEGMRRAIFGMIDELDASAARRGEPLGLIINYSVELTMDGIRVGRYADEVPPGQAVELTPPDQAMIFLRITDDFPTQEVLGPMIVNRPELPSLDRRSTRQSYGQNEGWKTDDFCRADGVACSDSEMKEPAIPLGPSSLEPAIEPICLGPIRLKFAERFRCVSATKSSSQPVRLQAGMPAFQSKALKAAHRVLPWAAFASRMPEFQSGLSPPLHAENLGHSDRKMFLRHWH